jgi:hypothetical protein
LRTAERKRERSENGADRSMCREGEVFKSRETPKKVKKTFYVEKGFTSKS